MEIIDRILQLAERRGMTANKLAVECKLNNSQMTYWKNKRQKPSIDALIKIADYFNVSVDYLIGRTKQPTIQHAAQPQFTYNEIPQDIHDEIERQRLLGRAEELQKLNKTAIRK